MYRSNYPWTRSAVVYSLLALGLASLALPGASAGAIPVPTNQYGALSTASLASAVNGQNAAVYEIVSSQTITETGSTVSCSDGTCYQLNPGWANVSNPFRYTTGPSLSGSTPLSYETWVNTTTNCGNRVCPQATLQCDQTQSNFGSNPSIAPIPLPCYALGILWKAGGAGQIPTAGSLPIYNVTRLLVYEQTTRSIWTPNGKTAIVLAQTLVSPSPAVYGTLVTTKLTAWSVPYVAWSIPYPKGTWSLSQTSFVWANQSTVTANFSTLSTGILADFTNYPTIFCVLCGPTGAEVTEVYDITLIATSGYVASGGSTGQNATANQTTNRSGPGIAVGPPTSLSLNLGNFTQSGISDAASVTWTNNYTLPFVGSVYLSAPFLANATGVKVYINGNLLTQSQWTQTETAVGILPGVANVSAQTAVVFSVVFDFVSSATPTSILFYLNGFGVTAPVLLVAAGFVVVLVYAIARTAKRQYGGTAANILSVGVFVLSIAYVIELSGGFH